MSYMVLARKWRPMIFEDVVAQAHVTTTLVNAISSMRLASAYLFSGPRGVGKTTTARIFAKAINCDKGPTPTPCNQCTSCNEITQSRSIDVFEVDGASNRGIDEVRNLRETLKYAPSKGKYKIYIIDEVHMLTTEAFNALLKTLEEPPARVLFIFATTEPHKVPVTILSRCQRYDFRRIPLPEIVGKLKSICSEEHIEIDEESLFIIAKKAEGSLRDSQSLLDQVVSFCGQNIQFQDMAELLGIIDQEFYFECSDCVAGKDIPAGLQIVDKIFNQGYDMAEFLNGFAEHLRNILVVKATGQVDLLEGFENLGEKYKQTVQTFTETDLLRLIQMCAESSFQVKRSTNPKLLLEMLFVKMIKMDKSVELDELLMNLSDLGRSTTVQTSGPDSESKSPPLPQPQMTQQGSSGSEKIKQLSRIVDFDVYKVQDKPADNLPEPIRQTAIDPEVTFEKIKMKWPAIIDSVKGKKIHLGSFLNEGFPSRIEGNTLEVSFGKENGFHIKTITQNKKVIQEVIFELTGFRLNLVCKKNATDAFNKPQADSQSDVSAGEIKDNNYSENMKDVTQIPMVKKVLEVFGGELVTKEQLRKS